MLTSYCRLVNLPQACQGWVRLFIKVNVRRGHPNEEQKIKEEEVGGEVFIRVESEAGGAGVGILSCSAGRELE